MEPINIKYGRAIASAILNNDPRIDRVIVDQIKGSEVCVTAYDKIPETAVFTMTPLSEKGELYSRCEYSYSENTEVHGKNFSVFANNVWWERQYDVTPADIGSEDYYDMVLTDMGEWCFAPLFKEWYNEEELKYTTLYYEEIETKLLSA